MSADEAADTIGRLVRRARTRRALALAWDAARGPNALMGLALTLVAVVVLRGLGQRPEWGLIAACILPLTLGVWGFRGTTTRRILREIDEALALHDLLGSAWEFHRAPPRDVAAPAREAIVHRIVARAVRVARAVPLARVYPLRRPEWTWRHGGALVLIVLAAQVRVDGILNTPAAKTERPRVATAAPPPVASTPRLRRALSPLQRELQQLRTHDDSTAEIARRLDALLVQVVDGETTLLEALAAIDELHGALDLVDAQVANEDLADLDALSSLLRDVAEAVRTEPLGERLAKALSARDQEALRRARAQLGAPRDSPPDTRDPAADEDTRRLLKKTRDGLARSAARTTDTRERLQRLQRQLDRAAKNTQASPESQARQAAQRAQLEKLRKRWRAEQRAREQLERLRAQVEQAMRRAGQRGASTPPAGQTTEANTPMQQVIDGLADAAAQASRQERLTVTREALRSSQRTLRALHNAGADEENRAERMRAFSDAASGRPRPSSRGPKGPTQGKGATQGRMNAASRASQIPGQRTPQPGQGRPAQAPRDSARAAGGPGAGNGASSPPSAPMEAPPLATRPEGQVLQGVETAGRSRAQVIRSATQAGFSDRDYRDVFIDYRAFAQSALDDETIPASLRETARRYFRLIQPRD